MTRLVLLGPPGVGKGTQAARLARAMTIPHLSTGDLLRSAVAADTPLGREADGQMRAGRLVPDALVLAILTERIGRPDCAGGFLLDGYPRNVPQAEELGRIAPPEAVLAFDLPADVLIERLSGRRVCPQCQSVYHLVTQPPRVAGHCDRDGAPLDQRPDDRPEAVRTRLAVYAEKTAPLLEYYRVKRLLYPVDARGTPDEVAARVLAVVAGLTATPRASRA